MKLTPKTLTDRISQLISDGHKKQDAAKIVYGEMRAEWKSKYPGVKLPSWLLVETRMKNPVKKRKRKIGIGKLNEYFTVSPNTSEIIVSGKKYSIYDAYPTLKMADKYASQYKKQGNGDAVVRDLTSKAGRLRYALFVTDSFTERFYKGKNPVRPLRKNKNDWNVDRFKDGKWEPVASFKFNKKKEAIAYANAYANAHKVKMKIYK